MSNSDQFINVRPSARILRVLGDIEFEAWQCLAELIDNAFDDFLEIARSGTKWPDGFKVGVTLPRLGEPISDSSIIVQDSGRGMDLETMNNAVRAGWSSNDRFSKLGLFGMGFNIATARLGRVTRVLTARRDDEEWVGVEIDLDNIKDDFHVPVIRRAKGTPSEHGTIIEVTKLDPSRCGWLSRNAAQIRNTLGDVYSYLLSREPFELFVNDVKVPPRLPCIWDASRNVTYGKGSTAEVVPAVIPIDKKLPDADACLNCGNWQPPGETQCGECGAKTLIRKERRIHGWLGIQRFLHKADFGIDFLRNGRKILRYDKRLFSWTDPNDPLATPELEYPVELGQGGRIVGEIHLDYVPVNYQKNAFEWSDRNWISAVKFLRGDGPLLPRRAKQLNYPPNDSPLARLHRAYRRNDPGYRCLIPGNGNGPIHATTFEWADKFHKGDPEYKTDEKWWQAVVYHEAKAAGVGTTGTSASTAPSGDVLDELGLKGGGAASTPTAASAPGTSSGAVGETEQERIARYIKSGVMVPELSREYGLVEFGATVEVKVYLVNGTQVIDSNGHPTPLLLTRDRGKKYNAFIDGEHPVYKDFAEPYYAYLVLELANHLKVRAEHEMPLSEAVARIKDQQLADLKVDPAILAAQARELLGAIREKMADAVASNPDRAWQFLTPDERSMTETTVVVEGERTPFAELRESGEFISFTPLLFTARLVQEWPEAFMDGLLFKGPFAGVTTSAGKQVSVGRIVSYLYDAALLADQKVSTSEQLARCKYSLQLLRAELAGPGGGV